MPELKNIIEQIEKAMLFSECEHKSMVTIGYGVMEDALALLKAQEPIEARLHLCKSCTKEFPECEATVDDIEFGCGVGNDNIIGCLAYVNRWKAQEPRLVTESDYDGADEYGYIPVWTEEKDGDMYWECIPKVAITDPDGIGVLRYWTSRPTDEQREAIPWMT